MNPNARWAIAYAAALIASSALALTPWGGDVAFFAGAATILVSVGYIGSGGQRRIKVIRNITGMPIAKETLDPAKRAIQLSTGMKVFLLGLALWVPLVVRTVS